MSGISTAIGSERVSRVSGYKIQGRNFSDPFVNLPQQILILAEANHANQGSIVTTPVQITSAAQAGAYYGWGSPIHQIMRILRPTNGDGVGGIPTIVMAQLEAGGATASVIIWNVSAPANATANATHTVIIAGRDNVDFKSYSYAVAIGDSATTIAAKMATAISAVLGCPVTAVGSATGGTFGTSSVAFGAGALTAGQTVTLAGLTYTSTAGTTQAQLAAAFASLANGATTGPGTGTGTYSGALTGFATGTVTSNTVVFTAVTKGPAPTGYPVVQTGNGTAAVITNTAGTYATGVLTATSKWFGITSADISISISLNGTGLAGLSYAQTSNTPGAGAADISGALTQFESTWYTLLINSYGTATLAVLEAFNGKPDPINPTGRYSPTVFMPFIALFGSNVASASSLVTITDASARIPEVTNVLCPAPGSNNMPYEAAANAALLFAVISQNTPHLTIAGQSYPDSNTPTSNLIGDMSDYNNRDLLKGKGCSTVKLVNGAYQVQDFVTTYHPTGEVPLIFNEARYLIIDWNIRDGYGILETNHVKDKVIVADGQYTTVSDVIRPSDWKAILFTYFDFLASIALISDAKFSKDSLQVQIDPSNPNRFNTTFNYKRTGTSEIESTDVAVGF